MRMIELLTCDVRLGCSDETVTLVWVIEAVGSEAPMIQSEQQAHVKEQPKKAVRPHVW
jgi:hypothetical protein